MTIVLRQALRDDIVAMHLVRMMVRENRLTSSAIEAADYIEQIEQTGRGWLIEDTGRLCGFAVGNASRGNIWALFVDPAHEGCGHGRRLHDTMVDWLFAQGLERLWLGTEPGTRAQRFYEAAGWRFTGQHDDGEAGYEMQRSNWPLARPDHNA